MVRVHAETSDKITAWRVRDRLAVHPLLGGAAVQIDVRANHESVVLTGWTADARLLQLVEQLSKQAAGRRSISLRLHQGCFTRHTDAADFHPNVAGGRAANISLT